MAPVAHPKVDSPPKENCFDFGRGHVPSQATLTFLISLELWILFVKMAIGHLLREGGCKLPQHLDRQQWERWVRGGLALTHF